jgi:GT2 family glycosyltransferase/MoaA/NifB/PqqE/SkfB family radical SAM enzyme
MKNLRASVIVTAFNSKHVLPLSLEALKKQTFKEFDIYLMDDKSTDGTSDFVKKNYPKINFFEMSIGVDKKRNIAISKSNSDYVITVDSDAILREDWIEKAIKYMDEHQDVGICCGKLIGKEGRIDYAGSIFSLSGGSADRGHDDVDKPEYNIFSRSPSITTAAAIIRRKMINEIGAFDESYFYGYEDTDLGLRANFSGWKVMYNPDLIGTHLYHSSLWKKENKGYVAKKPNISFYHHRNKVITYLKNFETKTILLNLPYFITSLLVETWKDPLPSLKAYHWIFKNWREVKEKRIETFQKRKIRDKQLFDIINFPKRCGDKEGGKIQSLLKKINNQSVQSLTFFITTKCNSRCKHCFYWKELNSKDISLEEIEKIISKFSNIQVISLSGGEPFLRKDLNQIIKLIKKYTGVKIIDIPTNCLIDISKRFEEILIENPDINFSIDCSLDGMKEDHDFIRGVDGSFEKTIVMIKKFSEIRKKYPNFKNLAVNSVLTSRNYKNMPQFIKFIKTLPIDHHTFDIIRGDYQDIMSPPKKEEIIKFNKLRYQTMKHYNSKSSILRRIFNNKKDKELIRIQERILFGKKWPFECTAGKNDFILESDGKMRICELTAPVGDLLKNTPEELLKNEKSKAILKQIKNHQCDCTHICNLSSSMDYSLKNLVTRFIH